MQASDHCEHDTKRNFKTHAGNLGNPAQLTLHFLSEFGGVLGGVLGAVGIRIHAVWMASERSERRERRRGVLRFK